MADFDMSLRMQPKQPLHIARMGLLCKRKLGLEMEKVVNLLEKAVRRNVSGGILVGRSGRYRSHIHGRLEEHTLGWVGVVEVDLAQVPYGRIHDLGGQAGRNHATHIPKRGVFRRALKDNKTAVRAYMKHYAASLVRY